VRGGEGELTLIIKNNSQRRNLIPLRDPIHAPRDAEQKRAVADNLTHELPIARRVRGHLDAERPAPRPAEPAAAAVDPRPRQRGLDLVRHDGRVGDGLDAEDGVLRHRFAHARREVRDVVIAVAAGLGEVGDRLEAVLVLGPEFLPPVAVSARFFGEGSGVVDVGVQLLEGRVAVGAEAGHGGNVEDRHLLLERVDVDVEDLGVFLWVALSVDPRHVAVDDQDDVGGFDAAVDSVSHPDRGSMIRWETHVRSTRIQHAQAFDRFRQLDEFGHRSMIASTVSGDDEWFLGLHERLGNLFDSTLGQSRGFDRTPMCLLQVIRLQVFLHRLSRTDQIHRALWIAHRERQRPIDHLLDILTRLDLPCVAAVLRHDLLLIRHVLDPMDVFGPGPAHLALDGKGRQTGEDEDGSATAGRVVDGSAETLGAHIHVHDHALRLVGQTSVSIRHGKCHHLVESKVFST